MRISYIGDKPSKVDNVAGTGLTWTPGQVHEVENLEAARKLLAHSGVWALDDAAENARRAEEAARLKRENAALAAEEARLQADRDAAARIEAERLAAEETAAAKLAQAEPAAQPDTTPPASLSTAKAPGEMGLDELKAFCKAKGMKFHPNISKETLLERLVAA